MSKSALSDAYAAGFKDGRESAGKVRDDDAADHCALGFDGWWQHAVDTTDRSSAPARAQPDQIPKLDILCQQTNPPKPVAVSVLIERRPIVAVGLDEFKRCAADMERLERALSSATSFKLPDADDIQRAALDVYEVRKTALDELKAAADMDDTERAHLDADNALMEFVRALGFNEVADAFDKVQKWYA